MKILGPLTPAHRFTPQQSAEIRSVLDRGKVIVYPTDTLYGLGVNACSAEAVHELYSLKFRGNSPVSVLLASLTDLYEMTETLSPSALALIETFLPGALTVICKSHYDFAPQLKSPTGSVGFRIPGDQISRQIPELFGGPITTTSVNPAGFPPAASRPEVESYFAHQIDLMIDIGPMALSKGSTVIDLTTHPFKILREGEISRQALQDFLN